MRNSRWDRERPQTPRMQRMRDGDDAILSPHGALAVWQRRVVYAVIEGILADEDDRGAIVPGSGEACTRAVRAMDETLARASGGLRRGFAAMSLVMEWLPLFVIGAPSRMSRLPVDRRVAYLEALESSKVGLLAMLFVAFKIPLAIPAFEEGDELASTGFDRPSTTARRRMPIAPIAGGSP